MKITVTGTRGIPYIMGGVETHCEELYPRIVEMGEDVVVVRRTNYVTDELTEWKGVRLVSVDSPKKKSLEAIVHTFHAINKAKALGTHILHVHAIGPALLTPYAKLRGLKVVFTHHGFDYDRDKWGRVAKIILRLGECMGCMFADEVIVISNVIKNSIARKYRRTRHVHLIYNGVPLPEYCDYPVYFNELGIEEGWYVLGTCRFVPEKRLHDLVEAFIRLKDSGQIPERMRLVLAGDTDFEDDYSRWLKQKARDNDVVLTGFIKGRKLQSLLTHAACYVLPSSHEGLPISLLEAMSYRLPVIVSDIPANLEVNLSDESYFHVGDVNQLVRRLQRVLVRPLSRVDYDMSKYDWNKIACQIHHLYQVLMNA